MTSESAQRPPGQVTGVLAAAYDATDPTGSVATITIGPHAEQVIGSLADNTIASFLRARRAASTLLGIPATDPRLLAQQPVAIDATADAIAGESFSLAFALGIVSAYLNRPLEPAVAGSSELDVDGLLRPLGGTHAATGLHQKFAALQAEFGADAQLIVAQEDAFESGGEPEAMVIAASTLGEAWRLASGGSDAVGGEQHRHLEQGDLPTNQAFLEFCWGDTRLAALLGAYAAFCSARLGNSGRAPDDCWVSIASEEFSDWLSERELWGPQHSRGIAAVRQLVEIAGTLESQRTLELPWQNAERAGISSPSGWKAMFHAPLDVNLLLRTLVAAPEVRGGWADQAAARLRQPHEALSLRFVIRRLLDDRPLYEGLAQAADWVHDEPIQPVGR